jgi:hypothetical protein
MDAPSSDRGSYSASAAMRADFATDEDDVDALEVDRSALSIQDLN